MSNQSTNTAIDLSSINFSSIGRKEKETTLADFFTEKVLRVVPESLDIVKLQGLHKVAFSKIGEDVQVHIIRTVGSNVQVAVASAEETAVLQFLQNSEQTVTVKPELSVEETIVDPAIETDLSVVTKPVFELAAEEESQFVQMKKKRPSKSTRQTDRTVFDADGNVLRQAPITKEINRHHVWQLEVLANEFLQMDPLHNFGIHLRPAMWHGKPVSIMMSVYTIESEVIKTASPKDVKINLLSNPDKIEEWLAHVQKVYSECAARLLEIPIRHESGFRFNRLKALRGELEIVEAKRFDLTPEVLQKLERIKNNLKRN